MRFQPLLGIPLALALGIPVIAQTASPSPSAMEGGAMKGDAMKGDAMKGGAMTGTGKATLQLQPQNGSGESGTATLTQTPKGVVVSVTTDTAPAAPQPAHIHKGTCANLDPAPAYPLSNVTSAGGKGASMTTVSGVTLAQLESAPYAINLHKSTSDIKDYVACTDIKAGGAMSPSK